MDTGFIVFNRKTYPNLAALFRTSPGSYAGIGDVALGFSLTRAIWNIPTGLSGLLAQPGNLLRPRFWSMLRDLVRFYDRATRDAALLG